MALVMRMERVLRCDWEDFGLLFCFAFYDSENCQCYLLFAACFVLCALSCYRLQTAFGLHITTSVSSLLLDDFCYLLTTSRFQFLISSFSTYLFLSYLYYLITSLRLSAILLARDVLVYLFSNLGPSVILRDELDFTERTCKKTKGP